MCIKHFHDIELIIGRFIRQRDIVFRHGHGHGHPCLAMRPSSTSSPTPIDSNPLQDATHNYRHVYCYRAPINPKADVFSCCKEPEVKEPRGGYDDRESVDMMDDANDAVEAWGCGSMGVYWTDRSGDVSESRQWPKKMNMPKENYVHDKCWEDPLYPPGRININRESIALVECLIHHYRPLACPQTFP